MAMARPALSKPAPSKPAPVKPAVAKPAPVAVKPGKPVAPATPAKPVAAKPAPATNGASTYVTQAVFDAYKKEVQAQIDAFVETFEAHARRMDVIETGDEFIVYNDETQQYELDLKNAPEDTLRRWAWRFNVGDYTADADSIRKALEKHRKAADFAGWEVVNDSDLPPWASEETGEGEAVEYTEEQINKANWTQLCEIADSVGIDRSDLTRPVPKILRTRIIEALTAPAEEEAEAAEEGEGVSLEDGMAVIVNSDGEQHPATFRSWGESGETAIVEWTDGEQNEVPVDTLTLPEE